MPGKRRKWDEKSMKNAVDAVVKGEMGYFKAARLYEVPQTTLVPFLCATYVMRPIKHVFLINFY